MIIEQKRYEIEDVFNLIGEECLNRNNDSGQSGSDIVVDGFNVHPISLRYMTFYQKGTKCVCCGKEGTHFKLSGDEGTNRRHFNLYAEDGTLMTKDHILPKSKGGLNRVSNMQTMCTDCNSAKGSYCPGYEKEYIVGRNAEGKEIAFSSIEKAVYHLVNNHMKKKNTKEDWARKAINITLQLLNVIETGECYHNRVWTKEMR